MARKLVRTFPVGALALGLTLSVVTSAALFVGCSDDGANASTSEGDDESTGDGGVNDAAVISADAGVAPDAGDGSSKRDCSNDAMADGLMLHLACTGLYADFASKTLASDALPYRPAVEFWSDGAEKARFLHLPAGTTIDVSDFDAWTFPNGTKAWKEFKVAGKRLETRLYTKDARGTWRHTIYRWNDDETDAVRKDAGELVTLGDGSIYEIPNTGQCNDCHTGRPEQLLGVEAVSLGLAGAEGQTLATLAASGKLGAVPPATSLRIPDDGTTKAPAALGWLHVNCGACHAEGGGAEYVPFRARIRASQLLEDGGVANARELDAVTTGLCKPSTRVVPDAGTTTYSYFVGADADASLVAMLVGRRVDAGQTPNQDVQMPPLVSRKVDADGHALLRAWIDALPACL